MSASNGCTKAVIKLWWGEVETRKDFLGGILIIRSVLQIFHRSFYEIHRVIKMGLALSPHIEL